MRNRTKMATGVGTVLATASGTVAALSRVDIALLLAVAALLAFLWAFWNERRNFLRLEPVEVPKTDATKRKAVIRVHNEDSEEIKNCSARIERAEIRYQGKVKRVAKLDGRRLEWDGGSVDGVAIGRDDHRDLSVVVQHDGVPPQSYGFRIPKAGRVVFTIRVTASNNPAVEEAFSFGLKYGTGQAGDPWVWQRLET